MTITEDTTGVPLSDGNAKAEVERLHRQAAAQGRKVSAAELGRQVGVPARTASTWVRQLDDRPSADHRQPTTTASAKPRAATSADRQPRLRPTQPADRPTVPADDEPAMSIADRLLIYVVAAVVAALSYSHIVDLAMAAGHGWRSYLAPVALDGLTLAAIRAQRLGRHLWTARLGIAVGVVGSVGANVLAVRPELVNPADVSAVLAAFPPIALAVVVHLVRR